MKLLKNFPVILFLMSSLVLFSCEKDPAIEKGNYRYENQELILIKEIKPPTVTTRDVSGITRNSASCGGFVMSDDLAYCHTRGVCWSLSQNPTISDSHTTDGSGNGWFFSSITELSPNTTYYVKAYAINSAGIAYGNEVSFTTEPVPEPVVDEKSCHTIPILTDGEGNRYATIQIGDQCWMRDNLRAKHSPDGTLLHYNNYNSNGFPLEMRGFLYTWSAAMLSCPLGWHLPSDAEWTQLCDASSDNAKALASTEGWNVSTTIGAVGNNQTMNNTSGFTAIPVGGFNGSSLYGAGLFAYFWSSSQSNSSNAFCRYLYYDIATVNRNDYDKNYGFSVRCVKD